jgi:hypothetical protein
MGLLVVILFMLMLIGGLPRTPRGGSRRKMRVGAIATSPL